MLNQLIQRVEFPLSNTISIIWKVLDIEMFYPIRSFHRNREIARLYNKGDTSIYNGSNYHSYNKSLKQV